MAKRYNYNTEKNTWKKAYQTQTIMFGENKVTLEEVKIIILAAMKKIVRNKPHMWDELYSDCLSKIPKVAIASKKLKKDKKNNINAYIYISVKNELLKSLIKNHPIRRGPEKDITKKETDYIYLSYLEGSKEKEDEQFDAAHVFEQLRTNSSGVVSLTEKREKDKAAAFAKAMMVTLLNEREQFVIQQRYLKTEQVSLQKIGNELGICREWVRQIEEKALNKLRAAMKQENFS